MTKTFALAGASWIALLAASATAQTTITGVDDGKILNANR